VTREQAESFAREDLTGQQPPDPEGKRGNNGAPHDGTRWEQEAAGWDVAAFLARATQKTGVLVNGPYPDADGSRIWKFDSCPFQPEYIGANASTRQDCTGRLGFHCFCGDHPEKHWKDLRTLVDGPESERQKGHSLRSFGERDNGMTEAVGTFGGNCDGLRCGRQR